MAHRTTMYQFLFPCFDVQSRHWCIMAAQPMGNVFIEGGFASHSGAASAIAEYTYSNEYRSWVNPKPYPVFSESDVKTT